MFGKCPKRMVTFSSAFMLFAQRIAALMSAAITFGFISLILEAEGRHEVGEVGIRIGARVGQILAGKEMAITDLELYELVDFVDRGQIDLMTGEIARPDGANIKPGGCLSAQSREA